MLLQHGYLNLLRESGATFQHLQSLRDVFTVHLTPSAAEKQTAPSSAGSRAALSPFVCLITGLPCTSYPFAALPACGHAFSSRAIAEARSSHFAASPFLCMCMSCMRTERCRGPCAVKM